MSTNEDYKEDMDSDTDVTDPQEDTGGIKF